MAEPSLTANTGKSDPNSVWATLGGLFDTGFGIYNKVTGKSSNAPAAQASAPPATEPAWKKYLPWAIGAVAVLVVLGFVFKRK